MPGSDVKQPVADSKSDLGGRRKSLQHEHSDRIHVRFQEEDEIILIDRPRSSTLPSKSFAAWREKRLLAKQAENSSMDSPRNGNTSSNNANNGGISPRLTRLRSNTVSSPDHLQKMRSQQCQQKDSLTVPDSGMRQRSSSFGGGSSPGVNRRQQQQPSDNGLISPLARKLGRNSLKKQSPSGSQPSPQSSPTGSQSSLPEVSADMYIEYCLDVMSNQLLNTIHREPLPVGSDLLHEVLSDMEDFKPQSSTPQPEVKVKQTNSPKRNVKSSKLNGHTNRNNKVQGVSE